MSHQTKHSPGDAKRSGCGRSRTRSRSDPETPRFHIFLIDTGWNAPVSKVLHEQMPLFHQYHPQDPLYILTREQSIRSSRRLPSTSAAIRWSWFTTSLNPGRAGHRRRENYHGFRLNLGIIKNPEQALAKLQEFLKFIAKNRTADCLDCEVKRELHREGLGNMVKLLREASEASLELL